MSDSAEGNVSQGGPKPGGEDAGLKAEDAERYAAAFVPVWQFDEAPFAAGARMSASDLQELGAPSGVASGRTLVDGPSPVVAPTASDPAGATEKVATISEALASALVAPPDSAPVTPASPAAPPASAPASPVRAATRSAGAGPRMTSSPTPAAGMPAVRTARSKPAPAREQLDDVDPFPKPSSNRNLLVGAGVAAVVAIGAILALRGGSTAAPAPASAAPTVATPHPTEESHIPPPPPAAETAAATAAVAPEPPPPPAAQPAAPAPPAVTTAPPPVPATAAAPTGRPPVTQRSDILRPPPNRGSTSKPSTKPGSGGIVRDNPF